MREVQAVQKTMLPSNLRNVLRSKKIERDTSLKVEGPLSQKEPQI